MTQTKRDGERRDECLPCYDFERAIRIYREIGTPTYDRLAGYREAELKAHRERYHKQEVSR